MGLDIHIGVNNYNEVHDDGYYDAANDYFNKHSLSRTFCNFMCRQHTVSHEAELNQIGRITGTDISPLYEMESYPDEDGLRYSIEYAESDKERQNILARAEADREKLTGNIDKVRRTVSSLIEKLNAAPNLHNLLQPTDFDSLDNAVYFSNFRKDKGEGYIGNNFGQDLRNFCRFLDYAISKGTTTVWFNYG